MDMDCTYSAAGEMYCAGNDTEHFNNQTSQFHRMKLNNGKRVHVSNMCTCTPVGNVSLQCRCRMPKWHIVANGRGAELPLVTTDMQQYTVGATCRNKSQYVVPDWTIPSDRMGDWHNYQWPNVMKCSSRPNAPKLNWRN